jgi:hypothetical protein
MVVSVRLEVYKYLSIDLGVIEVEHVCMCDTPFHVLNNYDMTVDRMVKHW